MISAYWEMWQRTFDFTGCSGVSDFWWALLTNVLVIIGLALSEILEPMLGIIYKAYAIVMLVPFTSLVIRRLRDGGHHRAHIFRNFVPGIGHVVFIFLMCSRSKW